MIENPLSVIEAVATYLDVGLVKSECFTKKSKDIFSDSLDSFAFGSLCLSFCHA